MAISAIEETHFAVSLHLVFFYLKIHLVAQTRTEIMLPAENIFRTFFIFCNSM